MVTGTGKRYRARLAGTGAEIAAAQRLRHLAFHGTEGLDADGFDATCQHMLVEDTRSAELVCCFRFLPLDNGRDIGRSYSAQYYELSALEGFQGRIVELGRFCVHPERHDPDILRVAWGAMTRFVDDTGVELLFGCASFAGTDAARYHDAFAMLRDRHLGPSRWLPRVKAPRVFPFAKRLRRKPDMKTAMQRMPPLLRTYLMMGGWVSDHAVVDTAMNTLHVFTGVEIGAIPAARKKLLRAAAG
ncbi:GNAT family N-acetyltransferase [Primorskyibacter aestuariivivens]|uniref:GNAT family N-acetyltransferase n=1 Tax=Primorskyibacter aestuariivivens TaxID=1888912 RepID=UPI0023001385|nr:GNAT family N-acetyltransferase [Primorskyibacter aestuariivivens]MDA7428932.1 GNAT family N-acetyltransferase [Primorskyibacter aestuariivivens]